MFLLVETDRLHLFKNCLLQILFLGSIKLHFKGSIAVIISNSVSEWFVHVILLQQCSYVLYIQTHTNYCDREKGWLPVVLMLTVLSAYLKISVWTMHAVLTIIKYIFIMLSRISCSINFQYLTFLISYVILLEWESVSFSVGNSEHFAWW